MADASGEFLLYTEHNRQVRRSSDDRRKDRAVSKGTGSAELNRGGMSYQGRHCFKFGSVDDWYRGQG